VAQRELRPPGSLCRRVSEQTPSHKTEKIDASPCPARRTEFFANAFEVGVNVFEVTANAFEVGVNVFEVTANAFEVTANAFEVTANAFEVTVNVFEVGANVFEVGANAFEVTVNAFEVTANGLRASPRRLRCRKRRLRCTTNDMRQAERRFPWEPRKTPRDCGRSCHLYTDSPKAHCHSCLWSLRKSSPSLETWCNFRDAW
jgi:hypothetical protein